MAAEDYLDMLDAIEQGYDDDFKWVDNIFIESLRRQIDAGVELSENQKQAIQNIYNA
jgi:hypothetical protein